MKTRRSGALLLAAAGLALVGTPVDAQRNTETPIDRFGPFEGEQLQITTGTEDDEFRLGIALPTGSSQENSFSLIVAAPIRGGDDAMPASLDALANASRVTLRWGRFEVPAPTGNLDRGTIAEARDICRARRAHPRPGDNPDLTVQGCTDEPSNNIVAVYLPQSYREFLARIIPHDATDIGIEATVGRNDFEWVDPATLGQRDERHIDWSVAAHFTQYLRRSKTAFTLSAAYQRAYAAAEEQTLCPPNPANPATDCIKARGAPPNRNEHLLLSAGLRHQFMLNGQPLNLAIAPLVTYDVSDDIFGVDVPVYFMPGANGGLTGGVRFGYRSDRENEFSAAVFFGMAFNILN